MATHLRMTHNYIQLQLLQEAEIQAQFWDHDFLIAESQRRICGPRRIVSPRYQDLVRSNIVYRRQLEFPLTLLAFTDTR